MSPDEFASRARSRVRDSVDRVRLTVGLYPSLSDDGDLTWVDAAPRFRVSDVAVGAWAAAGASADEAAWCRRLQQHADRIAAHRLSFLGVRDHYLGDPIDWNRDHASGRAAPLRFAAGIDYRDFRVTGDAKLVWEINRHHHLVVLARAYRASGDIHYAEEAVAQIESWLQQCPFGIGMNWRSPLELAIRLINWVWTIDLLRDSDLLKGTMWRRIGQAVYLHLWQITRSYSHGSSANNHLIGEAAGVFIGSQYFSDLPGAARWRRESAAILAREIELQTYADGCSREQALGYHLFVLEFFLFAGLVARRVSADFSPAYWTRLERMLEFLQGLVEGGGSLPMFGDADDGYVLDLGDSADRAAGLLSVGAGLFGRADFKRAGGYTESARWLLGAPGRERIDAIPTPPAPALASRAFPDAGYYVLQCGTSTPDTRVSVVFDCGELGFKSIAAHGHADALSFSLRAYGRDVLVDPGTYDYFSAPAWRDYFRSTRAHNTVVVDGVDQSVMLGPFLWGARAEAQGVRWTPRATGATVVAAHDGYTRLPDPVVHRRTLDLDEPTGVLAIHDELIMRGSHRIALYFHLSEHCRVAGVESHRYRIAVDGHTVTLDVDPLLNVRALTASEDPIGGWVSRRYHEKAPATTLVATGVFVGSTSLRCRIHVEPAGARAS